MKISDALQSGGKALASSNSPHLDAEILLAFSLKKPKEFLFANPERPIAPAKCSKFKSLIAKRARGWPVAYLTGHKEFCGLDFTVTPDVLIPRPETELLVELGKERLMNDESKIRNVIDVGTGSGNIIISIAKTLNSVILNPDGNRDEESRSFRLRLQDDNFLKSTNFYAIDSSKKALRIAKLNARRHGVSNKIQFFRGNLLSPLHNTKCSIHNTLLVANLPYGWGEWKNNSSAATIGLKFEPKKALFTKKLGLYLIRKLFEQIQTLCHSRLACPVACRFIGSATGDPKSKNLIILLEHDPRQKTAISKLAKKYFSKAKIKFHKDLSGKNRVLEIET